MTKVLITTLPKSGTHFTNLLMQGLGFERHFCDLSEGKRAMLSSDAEIVTRGVDAIVDAAAAMPDNAFILDHIPFTKRLAYLLHANDVRVILMVRNPYDFVVSLSHYLARHPGPDTPSGMSAHQLQHWICTSPGVDIEGAPADPIAKRYMKRVGAWTGDEHTFLLRFEEIIGPYGGGLFSDQVVTSVRLRDFLGLGLGNSELARAMITSFNPSLSMFRRGQIGGWRQEMAPNTAEFIRLEYGRTMDAWGYSEHGELLRHANASETTLQEVDSAASGLIGEYIHLRHKARRFEAQLLGLEPREEADDFD